MNTLWPLNEIVGSFTFIVYHQEAGTWFKFEFRRYKLAKLSQGDDILAERIRQKHKSFHDFIKYLLIFAQSSHISANILVNKMTEFPRKIFSLNKTSAQIRTDESRSRVDCGSSSLQLQGLRAPVAHNSSEPDRSNYSP